MCDIFNVSSSIHVSHSIVSLAFRNRPSLKSLAFINGPKVLKRESVILNAVTAKALDMTPPWNPPAWVWSIAIKIHKFLLPILHRFDKCSSEDTCLNLSVLWWKAISGNKWGSQFYDHGMAYDLLPKWSRLIVAMPFCWLYPHLHHHVVAMRTKFIDQAVIHEIRQANYNISATATATTTSATVFSARKETNDVNDSKASNELKPSIIVLGAGFDTRALRLAEHANNWFEIDLPAVVKQKQCMFTRFLTRRRDRQAIHLPKLFGADLNNLVELEIALKHIFNEYIIPSSNSKYPTIFVTEAVLMYLKNENVSKLLAKCMETAAPHSSSVSFVFADLFPVPVSSNAPVGDTSEKSCVEAFLRRVGLRLVTWMPKAGRARHMGVARLI